MRSLKDLIDQQYEERDTQRMMSKRVTPQEAEWIQHKQLVNSLSTNHVEVMKAKLVKDPKNVNTHSYTTAKGTQKVNIFTIDFPELSDKFDTILSITEVNGDVKQVRYMAFWNGLAKAYIRYL